MQRALCCVYHAGAADRDTYRDVSTQLVQLVAKLGQGGDASVAELAGQVLLRVTDEAETEPVKYGESLTLQYKQGSNKK